MRIDLGMVLAIIFEYIIFIYYADTLFYRKRNKYLCYAIIALVYIADLFICARGKIVVNTLTFVVIHLVIFGVCYRISWKSALFQSILLAAITSACEFLVIFIPYIRIIPDNTIAMTSSQSLILIFAKQTLIFNWNNDNKPRILQKTEKCTSYLSWTFIYSYFDCYYNYACDESQYNITLIVIGVLHTNNNEYYYFCNKSKIDDNGNRESRVGSSAIKRKI